MAHRVWGCRSTHVSAYPFDPQDSRSTHTLVTARAMAYLPLRKIDDTPSRTIATDWLTSLGASLTDGEADRSDICRDVLTSIYYPEYAGNWETAVNDAKIPHATRLAIAGMDPRNITLEPEYYSDCEGEKFQRV